MVFLLLENAFASQKIDSRDFYLCTPWNSILWQSMQVLALTPSKDNPSYIAISQIWEHSFSNVAQMKYKINTK